MTGWLVTNGFLQSDKFNELYGFFQNSAQSLKIQLIHFTSSQLSAITSSDFSEFGAKPDFVLFWDKDVYLARRLERAGIRLFNSAHAVETCDSKAQTALALVDKVPMPKTVVSPKTFENVGYNDTAFLEKAVQTLGLPVVIKEEFGSFGQQVYLANTLEEAKAIVKNLGGKVFVLQQFVAESCGRDVRVNVVGNNIVCAMLRRSATDFRSNVTLGGSTENYALTTEEKQVALAAVKAVGCDFAGVDVLLGANGPLICEVNSNPHFKSTLDCTGVDLSQHILQYIVKCLNK